jgi:hypothetical protein
MGTPAQLPAPPITNGQFRADMTEFASTTVFVDSAVNYWLTLAGVMLNPAFWPSTLLIVGLELFTAHNLVLETRQLATVTVNGLPGLSKGVVSSESPGAVSVSYDTNAALEKDAGHWNLTEYGIRFIRLAKMIGTVPIQVGVSNGPAGTPSNGSGTPWLGPPVGL